MLNTLYNKRYCLPCTYEIPKNNFLPINYDNSNDCDNILDNYSLLNKIHVCNTKKHKSALKSNIHNHIGFIFEDGKILLENNDIYMTRPNTNIISYGINSYGIDHKYPGCIHAGIHAEIDAINKLPTIRNKHKHKQINLFITRLSITCRMLNSKPCNNCIKQMKYLTYLKGYNIKRIYYSDDNGNIIQTKLTNLEADVQFYSSHYKKNMQNVPKVP